MPLLCATVCSDRSPAPTSIPLPHATVCSAACVTAHCNCLQLRIATACICALQQRATAHCNSVQLLRCIQCRGFMHCSAALLPMLLPRCYCNYCAALKVLPPLRMLLPMQLRNCTHALPHATALQCPEAAAPCNCSAAPLPVLVSPAW